MTDTLTAPNDAKATPAPYLNIAIGEKPIKLFMSFGLLDSILSHLSEAGIGTEIAVFDAKERETILKMVLAQNPAFPEYGMAGDFDMKTTPITSETVSDIFGWVLEHSTDFFLRNAQITQKVGEKYKARTENLMPSVTGSKP